MRILSYNIHKGFTIGNRFVLDRMREALHAINADVVFLQEVIGEHSVHAERQRGWPLISQFEYLADSLWPHHAYGRNAIYSAGHHGNALLSKFPFISWENIDVSTNPFERRGLLHGVITADHDIHVICLHLDMHAYGRRIQVRRLCERIASAVPESAPLIIAGDFNDWQQHSARELEAELGVVEAHKMVHGQPARSFPCHWPLLRLDRIYIRGFTATAATCLMGSPWRNLSDHAAIVADLRLS
jgi:endonuclease/exonuclease/phosphatase family metal-dependent hydrolase